MSAAMVDPIVLHLLAWSGGCLITVGFSGLLVRGIVGRPTAEPEEGKTESRARRADIGAIVGKCENILTVTFIMADAITGLALIFAAKSIVRREDIEKDPRYYLGGTLVNLTFSVVIALLIRWSMRLL